MPMRLGSRPHSFALPRTRLTARCPSVSAPAGGPSRAGNSFSLSPAVESVNALKCPGPRGGEGRGRGAEVSQHCHPLTPINWGLSPAALGWAEVLLYWTAEERGEHTTFSQRG